jgi:hypothetical protein
MQKHYQSNYLSNLATSTSVKSRRQTIPRSFSPSCRLIRPNLQAAISGAACMDRLFCYID